MSMRAAVLLSVLVVLGAGCSTALQQPPTPPTPEIGVSPPDSVGPRRDADVPALPFPDNPDLNACGIPTPWNGEDAAVEGTFQGQLVEPTVYLYDSHERLHITGAVPSGSTVQVQLYQANPVLDFYYVYADTPAGPQTGRLAKH